MNNPTYRLEHDGSIGPLVAKLSVDLSKNHVNIFGSGRTPLNISYIDGDYRAGWNDGDNEVYSSSYSSFLSLLLRELGMPYDAQVLPDEQLTTEELVGSAVRTLVDVLVRRIR